MVAHEWGPAVAESITGRSATASTAAAPRDPTAQSSHTDHVNRRALWRTPTTRAASISG